MRFILLILAVAMTLPSMGQSKKEAEAWFKKSDWIKPDSTAIKYDGFGRTLETTSYLDLSKLKPHASIDKEEFARQYQAHSQWWKKAFTFLRETDLASLKPGRYAIDGDDVYATVTEGPLKIIDSSRFESHKNFQDIHYVISGKEKIGVAKIGSAKLVKEYDAPKDIMFYTADGRYYTADPGMYFIFFKDDAHRPGLQVDGAGVDKKIVVKVRRTN